MTATATATGPVTFARRGADAIDRAYLSRSLFLAGGLAKESSRYMMSKIRVSEDGTAWSTDGRAAFRTILPPSMAGYWKLAAKSLARVTWEPCEHEGPFPPVEDVIPNHAGFARHPEAWLDSEPWLLSHRLRDITGRVIDPKYIAPLKSLGEQPSRIFGDPDSNRRPIGVEFPWSSLAVLCPIAY